MFLAFLRVQIVMELEIQRSKLNITAQINYSNSKNEKLKEENKKMKNMYKASFTLFLLLLHFCISYLRILFSVSYLFLFIVQNDAEPEF